MNKLLGEKDLEHIVHRLQLARRFYVLFSMHYDYNRIKREKPTMILSTTASIQGLDVYEYLGIVTGEAILGANVFRDLFAGIRDVVGGRASAYEKELRRARQLAMDQLENQAKDVGANAVIGIDIDYETITNQDGATMLMVTVSGTALRVG